MVGLFTVHEIRAAAVVLLVVLAVVFLALGFTHKGEGK